MYPVIKSLSAAELGFIIVTVGDVQLAITERYRSIFVQIEKATEIKHRVGVMLHNRMCFPYTDEEIVQNPQLQNHAAEGRFANPHPFCREQVVREGFWLEGCDCTISLAVNFSMLPFYQDKPKKYIDDRFILIVFHELVHYFQFMAGDPQTEHGVWNAVGEFSKTFWANGGYLGIGDVARHERLCKKYAPSSTHK